MSTFYQPGRYWCKITGQDMTEAKTGTKQFVLRFIVRGKVDLADPEGDLLPVDAEYERTSFMALTDKTVDFVLDNLIELGFTGTSFAQLNPEKANGHSFVGVEHAFSCEHDTYKGETRERWRVAGGGGQNLKSLDDKGYKELDNLFGKSLKTKVKAARGTSVTPPLEEEPVGAADVPEDDIPF